MKIRFLYLVLLLFSISTAAYPIFYKCDKNGRMSEKLTSAELDEAINKFFNSDKMNQKQIVADLCKGNRECESQFKQIIILSGVSRDAAESALNKLITNTIQENGPINPEIFEFEKEIKRLARANYICREKIRNLSLTNISNEANTKNDDEFYQYYPYKSNYMVAATGCDGNLTFCSPNRISYNKKAIEAAVIMGADPYAALSVGMLEMGHDGIQSLYLDPIGVVSQLGCSGSAANQHTDQTLNSFGGAHLIKPGVSNNTELANRLKTYFESQNLSKEDKISYVCAGITDANMEISAKPINNSCCQKLNFTPRRIEDLKLPMTMAFLNKNLQTPGAGKNEPEFRIQKFNGFSKLMGGTEAVPAFRSGINFYKTPTYGFQGMDYILNTLLTSPEINKLIEEAETKYGKVKSHVICSDKTSGTYVIDSAFYFEKHKAAPRLEQIENKFKVDQNPESLNTKEQFVLLNELNSPIVKEKITGLPIYSSIKDINQHLRSNGIHPTLLEKRYGQELKSDEDIRNDVFSIPNDVLSANAKSEIVKLNHLSKKTILDRIQIENKNEHVYSLLNDFIPTISSLPKYKMTGFSYSTSSPEDIDELIHDLNNLKLNSMEINLTNLDALKKALTEKRSKLKKLESDEKSVQRSFMILSKHLDPKKISNYNENFELYKKITFEEYLSQLKISPNSELAEKAKLIFENPNKQKITQADYKRYMSTIYPERNTTSKASDFSWRPFTDDEIEQMQSARKNADFFNTR